MMWFINAVLLIVYFLPCANDWLFQQGSVVQMLLYHFFHGNLFHLLANGLSLYVILPRTKKWQIVAAYIIACIVALPISQPMLGFSNVIYALIGVKTPSFDSYWWRHSGTIIFFAVTLLMLFLPNVSGISHILSFIVGVAVSVIYRFFARINTDAARYV